MKKEEKKQRNKRYIEEHGTEKLRRQREAYANNPQEKIKKSQYYNENQPTMSKASRERAQAKKNDSDANLEKYEKETSFGPEFVCICCHKGLFENQVLEFNKKRESQICQDVLEKSCQKTKNNLYPFSETGTDHVEIFQLHFVVLF